MEVKYSLSFPPEDCAVHWSGNVSPKEANNLSSSPQTRRLDVFPPNDSFKTPNTGTRKVKSKDGRIFTVWPMSQDERNCNDEIHGSILIPPAVHAILDTAPVQRLGSLHQLGCAFYAYPCCTHTRKEHSLGVMKLSGKLAKNIQTNQKKLGVTKLDVLCISIAGLCHDLGHGPYSHAYEAFLAVVRKSERDHPELYRDRNERFKQDFGIEIPPLPEEYAHEKTSLMMIEFVLAILGLEIDWDNLDKPLKQVRDGLDAERFGLVEDDRDEIVPFTSRDFIFIKECIYGKPLEFPDAPVNQTAFVGRDKNKEFLYQIVNNKLSGWDTDRSDYFDRDSSAAKKEGANFGILSREVRVARGVCPVPLQCFECKRKAEAGVHLMLCHPHKLVGNAMNFFNQRIKNHEEIYTHKKTLTAELLLIDLLVEADRAYDMLLSTQIDDPDGLPIHPQYDNFPYHKLPISRAWMYPRLFLRLDDSILGIIENKVIEAGPRSFPSLRLLLKRFRGHDFYKCVGEVEIETIGGADLWALTEDDFKRDILNEECLYDGEDGVLHLNGDDFIIEKRELHCGSKEHNPVSQMRFYFKSDNQKLKNYAEELPMATEVDRTSLPMNTLKFFIKRSIRMYSRSSEKNEFMSLVFENWRIHKEQRLLAPPGCSLKTFIQEGDDDGHGSQPALLTQEDEIVTPVAKRAKRKLSV